MLHLIILLIFSIGFILASIFQAKTDAIVHEFERITKRCITPDFNKYQTLTTISVMLGSIALGIIFGLII